MGCVDESEMRNDHPPRPQTAHPFDPADVQAISDWLVEQGLYTAGFETLFAGFCERLVAAGVPLWRGQVAMRTLHPTVDAIAYRWRPASGVESASLLYSDSESEAWLQSPFHHMLASGTRTLRHRLDGEPTALPFPILDEFRGGGATDYYARVIGYGFEPQKDARSGVISSWTTDQPGGFGEHHIATLDRLLLRLALSLKSTLTYQISVNLLDTYVGPDAGRRILDGEIRRGRPRLSGRFFGSPICVASRRSPIPRRRRRSSAPWTNISIAWCARWSAMAGRG